jgi:hypothetical protein
MFGQVLDKLDNYFGRSFLVARYFPWLLCVASNLAIASIEFPDVRAHLLDEYTALAVNPVSKAIDFALVMLTIWVVAYATAPLVQIITEVLEGDWITGRWASVAQLFIASQADRREMLDDKYWSAFDHRNEMPKLEAVEAQWKRDRSTGAKLRAIQSRPAIEQAKKLIERLRAQRWLNQPVSRDDFHEIDGALSVALRHNCAEIGLLHNPDDIAWARKLHELHDEMVRVLAPYVLDISEQIEYRAQLQRDREFAKTELAPTRLGNDAAALRSYCDTRYGISFDLFWPRFLLLINKDDKSGDALTTAKIQLDFSILTWALTLLSTLIWAVVIMLRGHSLWTFLIVYLLGPAVVAVWLHIVHASYGAFADLARSSVDLNRFQVLDALRRPLPPSTDAEKKIWEDFTRSAALGERKPNVTFRHPASK